MTADIILSIIAAGVPGLLALGAGWWRIARLERDVDKCATLERVEAIATRANDKCDELGRRIDIVDEGVEKKLDRLDEDVKAIRSMMERVLVRFVDETNPGRK